MLIRNAARIFALVIATTSLVIGADDKGDPGEGPKGKGSSLELAVELEEGDEAAKRLPLEDGFIFVSRTPAITGDDVKRSFAAKGPNGWTIIVAFKKDAAERFFALSKELTKSQKRIAIIVAGEVLSAPVVREPIAGGMVNITGDFTAEEAMALAAAISEGGE